MGRMTDKTPAPTPSSDDKTALPAVTGLDGDSLQYYIINVFPNALLALERFAGVHLPAHEGWVMASYTAAQALLASGGTAD